MVDANDTQKLEASKQELQGLLEKQHLAGIPLLVLGNKNDLPNALQADELIQALCVRAWCSVWQFDVVVCMRVHVYTRVRVRLPLRKSGGGIPIDFFFQPLFFFFFFFFFLAAGS